MKAGGSFRDAPCDPVAVAVPPCLDNGVCSYRDCSPELSYIFAGHPLPLLPRVLYVLTE